MPGVFEGGEGARGDELAQSVVAFVVGVFVEPEAVGAHEAVGVGGGVEVGEGEGVVVFVGVEEGDAVVWVEVEDEVEGAGDFPGGGSGVG
ncbi:MAG: hypothetical protein QGG64_04435 [Candidatus Latescibacteria bacterium]|nr:hypothetical protein [Candidatus Latescibacterota bacterium]